MQHVTLLNEPPAMDYIAHDGQAAEITYYENVQQMDDHWEADAHYIVAPMTREEAEQHRDVALAAVVPFEQRVAELEQKLASIGQAMDTFTARLNYLGNGVIEVEKVTTGKGTEKEPFALSFPCEAVPNAFYELDGVLYVYMNPKRGIVDELNDSFVEWND